ncbi:MAG: diaminopimelate decarboxylase [Bacteroidetes bacterium]|nr:diaminopimelate decarboxylase [Bacteroidota bacterium]
MLHNLAIKSIEKAFRSAISKGLIREEDTLVMFHDLAFLKERILLLKSLFPPQTLHGVAMKANPLKKILEFLLPLRAGTEVASVGELKLALKTGYPPGMIVFDSPAKTWQDLEFALLTGVHINIDSLAELARVASLKEKIVSDSTLGIRINPQVGIGTIAESSVAGEYSKFGIPVKTKREELEAAFLTYPWLTGVHLHVGSQGCSMELLLNGIGVLYNFVTGINAKRKEMNHPPISIFDIGGGLPVSYRSDQVPVSMEKYAGEIADRFPSLFTSHFSLLTEFGRWVHVNAGWTVSRVEYVKRDPGINTLMIHAGADLFIRECMNPESWPHEYSIFDRSGNLKSGKDQNPYNLAGPLCFSGDILARNVVLPVVEEGDTLVIHDTGGYTIGMWSRYNSRQTPRVIGYEGDEFRILRERESFEELERFWE